MDKNSTCMKAVIPDNLRGRSLSDKVIPTVCNLKNMLERIVAFNGEYGKLKPWEKRSYDAYLIDDVIDKILISSKSEWIKIIRAHILSKNPIELGASAIDIYLVAYVGKNFGFGKSEFFSYIKKVGISGKTNSAQAIWQVGKGDGVYLGILDSDGKIIDWDFIHQWITG